MLLFLFLFGLALGAEHPSGDSQLTLEQSNCPTYWYSFNGRCFKYVATPMTWADAELHCVSQGANLVSIHSMNENNFVKSLIGSTDPAMGRTWIGFSDIHKEGRWMWSDGTPADFVFWHTGEPSNTDGIEHCANENDGREMKWNDHQCSQTFPFVCVSRPVCP